MEQKIQMMEIYSTSLSNTIQVVPSWDCQSRVGIVDSNVCVFANNGSVYAIKLPYHSSEPNTNKTKNQNIPFPKFIRDFEIFEYQRTSFENLRYSEIKVHKNYIGCADEYGNVDVLTFNKGVEETLKKPDDRMIEEERVVKKRKMDVSPLQHLRTVKNSNPPYEVSRCHLCFHPLEDFTFVTSVYFSREINLYRDGNFVKRLSTLHYPGQVKFFEREQGCVFGVIDGPEVLIYDERMKSKAGRIQPRNDNLRTLDVKKNVIAVADSDRGVLLFDSRKWSVFNKIKKALKTTIHHTKFSNNHDLLYVAGANELTTNITSNVKGNTGRDTSVHFSGDLVGMDILRGCENDTIVAVSKSGSVYFLRNTFSVIV